MTKVMNSISRIQAGTLQGILETLCAIPIGFTIQTAKDIRGPDMPGNLVQIPMQPSLRMVSRHFLCLTMGAGLMIRYEFRESVRSTAKGAIKSACICAS